MNAIRSFDRRRWATTGVLFAAAVIVGLFLVMLLSSPADAHHRTGHGEGGGNPSEDLEARIASLEERVTDLESTVEDQVTDLVALTALLSGVERHGGTLVFSGMNLQVVNGQGTTNTTNGLGNVIIGYNADTEGRSRTGSHYLIVGDEHEWTRFGGIVAGYSNTASADHASVLGGANNTANGWLASVSGGEHNTAGHYSSISGGLNNTAHGWHSSVSGGWNNTASGLYSSVSGGSGNEASGVNSSVSGGRNSTASGDRSSILGGRDVLVENDDACHPSCP